MVDPDSLLTEEVDVLAPCALGGVINVDSVDGLRCRAIAGGANNVLAAPEVAADLQRREIVYAPDFCINAGGVIFLQARLLDHDVTQLRARVLEVGDLIADLLVRAERRRHHHHPGRDRPGRRTIAVRLTGTARPDRQNGRDSGVSPGRGRFRLASPTGFEPALPP